MNYPITKYIKKMAVKWAEERLLLPVIIAKCLGSERCFKLEVPKADIIQKTEQGWAKKETPEEIIDRIRRMSGGFNCRCAAVDIDVDTFDSWNIDVGCGFNRGDYEVILERIRRDI